MAAPIIEVEHVAKVYQIYAKPQDRLKQLLWGRWHSYGREFRALEDVSFAIQRGETVGIIGRNGSGKSTLLKLICGTLTPTQGRIQVTGKVAALLELGTGFNPDFTGRENLRMNAALHGLSPSAIEARMERILAFADIGAFIDQPIKTYSSGMKVRLAFAVIVHVDAEILVIDEALAVGDAFFVQKCMRFLKEFQEYGTLLFVSHDAGSVINLCSRAIWLEQGRQRAMGPARAVCEAYLRATRQGEIQPPTQEMDAAVVETTTPKPSPMSATAAGPGSAHVRDARLELINQSAYRNDIEILPFQPTEPSHGTGAVVLRDMHFADDQNKRLLWAVGGEHVTLVALFQCQQSIHRAIVGFYIKDRLGQALLGDNTYLTSLATRGVNAETGSCLLARFAFQMPLLSVGDYSVDVAVSEGTQEQHIHHGWFLDALRCRVQSSSVQQALVGLPMTAVHSATQPHQV